MFTTGLVVDLPLFTPFASQLSLLPVGLPGLSLCWEMALWRALFDLRNIQTPALFAGNRYQVERPRFYTLKPEHINLPSSRSMER